MLRIDYFINKIIEDVTLATITLDTYNIKKDKNINM